MKKCSTFVGFDPEKRKVLNNLEFYTVFISFLKIMLVTESIKDVGAFR